MRVACMNQGNLCSAKAVLLHQDTMCQGVLHSQAGPLQLQSERLWNHLVVRLVDAFSLARYAMSPSLMTF